LRRRGEAVREDEAPRKHGARRQHREVDRHRTPLSIPTLRPPIHTSTGTAPPRSISPPNWKTPWSKKSATALTSISTTDAMPSRTSQRGNAPASQPEDDTASAKTANPNLLASITMLRVSVSARESGASLIRASTDYTPPNSAIPTSITVRSHTQPA